MTASTPVEERLAFLVEELGEAVHMVGKSQRHGLDSTHADYQMVENCDNLAMELGHIQAIIDLLIAARDIDRAQIHEGKLHKLNKLGQFTHHIENRILIKRELAAWSA